MSAQEEDAGQAYGQDDDNNIEAHLRDEEPQQVPCRMIPVLAERNASLIVTKSDVGVVTAVYLLLAAFPGPSRVRAGGKRGRQRRRPDGGEE